jgi:hypothetical protein
MFLLVLMIRWQVLQRRASAGRMALVVRAIVSDRSESSCRVRLRRIGCPRGRLEVQFECESERNYRYV